MRVLISGAGIAGPATALGLARGGHEVVVVERAGGIRPGGQAVDFKGAVHRSVLERMGLWDDVLGRRTGTTDLHVVDEHGRQRAVIPGEFTGGDVEILRGDLSRLLYEHTRTGCEYVFGDHVTGLDEQAGGVRVTFARRPAERFDLVVGADGVHSAVRRLAFGPEREFVEFLGHYYAVAGDRTGAGGEPGRSVGLMFNAPGRLAVLGGPKAPELYVFRSPELEYDRRDTAAQKEIVRRAYAGLGWRVPEMLRGLAAEPAFYFDSISRVRMDRFSRGRAVLVGDSAYGNTLGGFGTGLALVGAHVLAGRLAAAAGDLPAALAGYDRVMLRYSRVARRGNAGRFLAPRSRWRIRLRDQTFANRLLYALMLRMTDRFATDIDLPDDALPAAR